VAGVLDGNKQLLPKLDSQAIQELIAQGVIVDGMAVKVHAALDAANTIQQPVTIASWRNPDLFAQHDPSATITGTTILADQHYSNLSKDPQ
jgi:acetylglutamate kinase